MQRVRGVGWPGLLLLALLVSSITWSAVAAQRSGSSLDPRSPYVVAPLALALGGVLGGLAARLPRHLVALGLFALMALLYVAALWTLEPGLSPLGYANANAALAIQLIGLAGLTLTTRDRAGALLGWAVIGLGVAVVLVNASRAGIAVTVPLVIAIGWSLRIRHRWPALLGSGLVIAIASWAVTGLADTADWPRWATVGFGPVRHELWAAAYAAWARHPVTGGGPGSFTAVNPLAADTDTLAAHSSVLQLGAETGWIGVGLFAAIAVAGLAWCARGAPRHTVVASATWAALLVHSFVDHVLDFPPVVLAAGVVLGWAGAGAGAAAGGGVRTARRLRG